MGRKRGSAGPRRKSVKVRPIERVHAGSIVECYQIMERLVTSYHGHLAEAKICIAANSGWKADVDGRTKLGTMQKAGDLHRSLHEYDLVLTINSEAWLHLSERQKTALIDHELCHAQIAHDKDGNPLIDTKGRKCYRIRRHDLEEFREVVSRYGCYMDDIAEFVRAVKQAEKQPLLAKPAKATASA